MPNHTAATSARQPPLLLLVGISAIAPIVMNGVLPATTAVMRDLETSYGTAQLVLTIYLFAAMVSQVLLGQLSDRVGRRPVMIGGLTVFALGGIVCAFAPTIETLLAGRFIQGLGSSVCTFLPRTIMRDVHPKDKAASAIGYMTTAMMIAPLFGPAVFGWLTDISSWRVMYVVLSVIGFLFAGMSYLFQHETLAQKESPGNQSNHTQATKQSSLLLLREPEYRAYLIIMCGAVGIYYCFLAGAPYVVMELRHYSATDYGTWFSMSAIGYLTGNLVAGKFSEKSGTNRMISLSVVPLLIGVVLFWALSRMTHPIGMFLPMQFIALSNGMCLPNLMSAAMSVRSDMSGRASGLLGTIQIGTATLITLVLSALIKTTALPLLWAITLCCAVALIGYLSVYKKSARDAKRDAKTAAD